MRKYRSSLVKVPILGAFALGFGTIQVQAADHLDPPGRTDPTAIPPGDDRNADIADVYAWHTGTGTSARLTVILAFSGPNAAVAGQAIPCDRDVLYSIHLDNNDDATPDATITTRFGKDDVGKCFLKVDGIPGPDTKLEGPVERNLAKGDVKLYAGLRDDAFFFDLQGFKDTVATGTLSFVNDRDFFSKKNTPAIVVEFPLPNAIGTGKNLRIWATTARITAGTP